MSIDIFALHSRLLSAQRLELLRLAETPLGRELHRPQLERAFKDLQAAIKFATPYTNCPFGPGCTAETCKACKGTGWITEAVFRALPKEFRDDEGRGGTGSG
jgi:hypothetical protein